MVACEYRQAESRSSSTVQSERSFVPAKADQTYQHVVLGGQRSGLVRAEVVEVVSLTRQGSLDMVDDGPCDRRDVYDVELSKRRRA